MSEVVTVEGFLDDAALREVLAAAEAADGAAATVTGVRAGATVAPLARKATRLAMPEVVRDGIVRRLEAAMPEMTRRFGVALAALEPPQFLRYETGDYFVAHQDGNTPLVYDDTRRRKVSVVVFLSRPGAADEGGYCGGALVLQGTAAESFRRTEIAAVPGTLVAFRAETTHEVTPVTHGVRCSIAAWYRAADP